MPVTRIESWLVWVALACAATVALGGVLSKSMAWTDGGTEGVGGWQDGVKPWAAWAVLGGVAVVALLWAGRKRGRALWVVAGMAAYALWEAARGAAAYRERLEDGMFLVYEEHRLSVGLRVVPVVGMVGAMAVAALAVMTGIEMVARRSGFGPR